MSALSLAPSSLKGRARFYDTSDQAPIKRVARFQVRSYVAGAKIKFEESDEWTIDEAGAAIEGPWERIQLTGVAVLRIWHDHGGPLPTTAPGALGTPTLEKADKVAAPNGAEIQALAANGARRSFGLQNEGILPVAVALVSGMNGGTGAGVVAYLAPCAVARDGSGGTFSLDGYTGPVFLWGVGGVMDVGVVAF